jgi:hypothetical protein
MSSSQSQPLIVLCCQVPPLTAGLESSERPPGADPSTPYTSMNLTNYVPPVRYNGNMGYDDASRQAIVSYCLPFYFHGPIIDYDLSKDHAEYRGNQGPGTHLVPGFTQYNPVVPGPPRLEYYAPVAPVHVPPFSCSLAACLTESLVAECA